MPPFLPENTLCIATSNKGKLREIKNLFAYYSFNIHIISTDEFDYVAPEENGRDFAENSCIKARYASQLTQLACVADDSGLCIDALDGQPGIHSARWALNEGNFDNAMKKIFRLLEEKNALTQAQRKAFFVCNLALAIPNQDIENFEGLCEGYISSKMSGDNGFGYDPIFVPHSYNNNNQRSFADMQNAEKRVLSHRHKAFEKLCQFLRHHNV